MATVHGVIYEWGTFEPLENVIVEVNSTPPQSMLARYGLYSFNLAPGNYVISASYYRNSTLVYDAQEEITIIGSGDYVIDIIFLPTYYESDLIETEFNELDELADLAESNSEQDSGPLSSRVIALLVMVTVVLAAGAYLLSKDRKGDVDTGTMDTSFNGVSFGASDKYAELPDDLRETVGIISRHGGRISQKELRGSLKHSEAKVSLMISDLENRGIVKKFKKGRGNVIILAVTGEGEPKVIMDEGPNQNI
ncbi:hypothetical protein [Methanolobus sp.]|uniref:helix-turn-helix transcriptional regulator n=1 Tax=Methanolobus sp. TaxID=1874737 RepID=UPI0025E7A261|nr:hypothetical protein [Methanolobus sp.]